MTAILEPNLWSTMPGWGIVADLTPPEVVATRRLRVIRRLLVLAMAVIVVLCLCGYALAVLNKNSASNALARETDRTTSLQTDQLRYRNVTQLQGSLTQVQGQLAVLLGTDVSFSPVLKQIRASLLPGMTINQASITIVGAGAAANTADPFGNSEHPHIGAFTLTGTAVRINDVAAFVDKLAAIPGYANVSAPSSQSSTHGVQYSITAAFTDQVLSHKFDAKNGGK
jgi:hypothetical protein